MQADYPERWDEFSPAPTPSLPPKERAEMFLFSCLGLGRVRCFGAEFGVEGLGCGAQAALLGF